MQRLTRLLLATITLCLLPLAAQANWEGKNLNLWLKNKLDGVSLNAAAADRTFTFDGDGWSVATFWIDYTHANNGTLTLTCTGGPLPSDLDYTLTTCVVAAGTCTIAFGGVMVTPSLTADKKYGVRLGIEAVDDLSCVIAHGGTPGAGDVVSLDVELEAN